MSDVSVVLEAKVPSVNIMQEVKNEVGEIITFGGKEFKILSLCYEDYCEFLELMTPFLEPLFSSDPNTGVDIKSIVRMLNKNLPRMVYLMIHKQDQIVSEDWIKKNASSPFELAGYVFKQMEKNKVIKDFADFFVLMRSTGIV